MNQYIVMMEFEGRVVSTSIWASDPDSVITILLGDDEDKGEFLKIISIKKINDNGKENK